MIYRQNLLTAVADIFKIPFKAIIGFYKKFISPFKPRCCRFSPSCSSYALEAIEVHGVIKGCALAFYRILRCNPFCKGGYDPVPEKKVRNTK